MILATIASQRAWPNVNASGEAPPTRLSEQGQPELAACDTPADDAGAPVTTTDEVVARLTKNWEADVRAFDAV